MNTFTVKEASDLTNLTVRAIQYKCKEEKIRKKSNRYLITQTHIDKWLSNENKRKNENEDATNVTTITQEFTIEEYEKLERIIKQQEVNLTDIKHLQEMIESYQDQIQYLRNSLDKKDEMMNRLIDSLESHSKNLLQKNYIEAREKGFDN